MIFIVLNLINNVFGCGSMILAGAQLVTGMTEMNVIAACILIPAGGELKATLQCSILRQLKYWSVVIYTAVGGIKATFLTDFLHTTIALILLLYFAISVLTNEHIGGPVGLYEKVLAADNYIEGNYQGSLLSFKSEPAVLFGLVLKFGNLALVLMDTAYWQKSFASEVRSTVPGYDLASIAIIAVPWCTGTIIGLSARAIEKTPVWVAYPETLTLTQVNSGLVMPYVLKSLLGTGATAGLLVLIFMAITSTISSSSIAVSSILSLDIFRTYIKPNATNTQIMRISHLGVVFHGCFMAGFAIMLEYAGATNNWSTYFRPIIACPGIFPMVLTILWSRQTKAAAISAPLLGLCSGVAVWLSLSWKWGGAIDITTTQAQLPGLYGAITSFFSPLLYSVVISLVRPKRFDWREFLKIDLIEDKSSFSSTETSTVDVNHLSFADNEKKVPVEETTTPPTPDSRENDGLDNITHPFGPDTLQHVYKWLKIAVAFFIVNVLTTIVLWPLPLYRDWIFTKRFFSGWVSMALVWQWFALFLVVIYPIYDGRHAIAKTFRGIRGDLRGRGEA